jgi:hypothetical protein
MVVAALVARPRVAAPPANAGAKENAVAKGVNKARRSMGNIVMIGVPVLLVLTFLWQVGSNVLRNDIAVRDAVAVSRVSLEADPAGSRIDMVLVDRVGLDTTVEGALLVKLREPDGTLWQVTRNVTAGDFTPLQSGSLLAGRTGYSIVIPANDWLRAPRRGGSATVSVSITRADGTTFNTVQEERFP